MNEFYDVQKSDAKNEKVISLKGAWTVLNLSEIHKGFKDEKFHKSKTIKINAQQLESLDTASAFYLLEFEKNFSVAPDFIGVSKKNRQMMKAVEGYKVVVEKEDTAPFGLRDLISHFGKTSLAFFRLIFFVISLFGEFLYDLLQVIRRRRRIRPKSVAFHLNEICIKALPVVFLMAFAISLVMGYQGATQLQNFGATIYTIDLVTISVLREMGVLLTAIMVAGRTGSAFAAQIGTMKMNEEIDALNTMGVSPFSVLIRPRLFAIVIALPILTFLANIVALAGLYVYCQIALDIPLSAFLSRIETVITPAHFWTGMVKAPVFALIIGMIGCMQGMRVGGSAEEVGRHTTYAVVQSIFTVIIVDALFSILYTQMGV